MMVIHKPAGLATQTDKLGQADVVSELKNHLHQTSQNTYLGVIHRLDQPVEGLLAFAKTPAAAKELTKQLQTGVLQKYYRALIPALGEGASPVSAQGRLTDYLIKDSRTNTSRVVPKETQGAKKAELSWKLVKTIELEEVHFSLVEIELYTGRHHQIRVQMSHAGMPLLGDSKYGTGESEEISAKLGLKQTALLACRLDLIQPDSRERLCFALPHPENWKIF